MKQEKTFEEQINSLDEKGLLKLLKKYSLTYPIELSTIEKLIENTEPVQITEETKDLFLSTMRDTMELRQEIEKKFNNTELLTSFGELLFLYREKNRLTIEEFAEKLEIASSVFRSIEDDNDSSIKSNIKLYVSLSRLTLISYEVAISLILNSYRIANMKKKTGFIRSYSRVDKRISEAIRIRKDKEADNKTLLRVSKKQETEDDRKVVDEIRVMLESEFREEC